MVQNPLVQWDFKSLWSSIFLEEIKWHFRCFYMIISSLQEGSHDWDWDYHFWVNVARCAQPCPRLLRIAVVLLIGLGGIVSLKTVHYETLINF